MFDKQIGLVLAYVTWDQHKTARFTSMVTTFRYSGMPKGASVKQVAQILDDSTTRRINVPDPRLTATRIPIQTGKAIMSANAKQVVIKLANPPSTTPILGTTVSVVTRHDKAHRVRSPRPGHHHSTTEAKNDQQEAAKAGAR
jgi:hypothetical protein